MEKANIKFKTNSLINGETVAYLLCFIISTVLLLGLMQLFKAFIGLDGSISVLVAFIIAEIASFLLEKRFVFHKSVMSSDLKQMLMFVFRGAVNFGFFKLSEAIFGNILNAQAHFYWLVAISICLFFNYFFDRLITFDCAYNAKSVSCSRIYKTFYSNRFILFSTLLAAACIGVMYMIYTIFPFGDATVMRMDLYHQYGPLFAELYDRVVNHQSFLYSWTSGGGSSFLGNYFNYLSSPLTTLIFFFDKKNISFAISFLVSVKCILSATSFTYYIKHSLKKHSYFSAVFGVFYAFSAYFLAYYWNVMWLDGMILLPLIALGIEKIINEGKIKFYIISLVLLFFSSYYMGFMSCIFAVIYFIAYFFISSGPTDLLDYTAVYDNKYSFKALNNNKFINRGIKFALASITSAGLCAFTLIPVFFILKSCSATSDSFPSSFESYFNIFDFITSHLAGLETTIRSSGADVLPNVYSGMLAAVLLPLYIANKDIRTKEKACYIVLLIFFLFSFNNNCLNFIWHAFHFPNDLPFRFSYMYSFIILVVGFRGFMKIKSLEIKDITFVGMSWIFFIILAQKMSTTKMLEATIYTSIAFIIIWTGFLCVFKRNKIQSSVLIAMAVVICFSEVIIADTQGLVISQDNKNYVDKFDSYTQAIDKIHSDDDGLYREELSSLETRMDPCYYGYNGMSTFSSMAYEKYSRLQYNLGMFGNRINSYTYNTQTPVYNMMFNLKYIMNVSDSIKPSDELYNYLFTTDDNKVEVYENRYHLPVAYCVNQNIDIWDTDEGNPFKLQDEFFLLSTGYAEVFKEVEYTNCEYDNISGDTITNNGTYWFYKNTESSSYGYVDLTITPVKSGNVYLYVTSPDIKSLDVSRDESVSKHQEISEPYILDCGYCEKGESIYISLDCGSTDVNECYADIYAYSVDADVLKQGYNRLKAVSLDITSHTDTSFCGSINADEDCYLYSSVPYDKGWSIYIDGEKAEAFEIGSSLLGAQIKAGNHYVEYKYTPQGFNYGIIITLATTLCVAAYTLYTATRKKRRASEVESESLIPQE